MGALDTLIVIIVLAGLFTIGYCYYNKITIKEFLIEIIDLIKYATGG